MAVQTPKIDSRSTDQVAAQAESLAVAYTKTQPGDPESWRGWLPSSSSTPDLGSSLMKLFAKMMGHVVQSINQLPEKNQLAFLNLLGAHQLPPRAARAPLTFWPSVGSTSTVVVPQGIEVAAPADGDKPEAIFQTERELVLSRARLTSVLAHEPDEDRAASYSALCSETPTGSFPAFVGDTPIEHALYLAADTVLMTPGISTMTLSLFSKTLAQWSYLPFEWQWWNGQHWTSLDRAPSFMTWSAGQWVPRVRFAHLEGLHLTLPGDSDGADLTTSQIRIDAGRAMDGLEREIVLASPMLLDLTPQFEEMREAQLDAMVVLVLLAYGQETPDLLVKPEAKTQSFTPERWLRLGRLQLRLEHGEASITNSVQRNSSGYDLHITIAAPPAIPLGTVNGVIGRFWRLRFTGLMPLTADPDLRLPREVTGVAIGQIQRSSLLLDAAFANTGDTATVPLDISKDFSPWGERPRFNDAFYFCQGEAFSKPGARITLQITLSDEQNVGAARPDLKIAWESWNGRIWQELGRSSREGTISTTQISTANFDDQTCAFTKSDATVLLVIPPEIQPCTISGRVGYYLRARILSGGYGNETWYDASTSSWVIETVQPPWVKSVSVSFSATLQSDFEACLCENDREYLSCTEAMWRNGTGIEPFIRAVDQHPALLLAFDRPLENQPLSFFIEVGMPDAKDVVATEMKDPTHVESAEVVWEFYHDGWKSLLVEDESKALQVNGCLRVVGPAQMERHTWFGHSGYWLRARFCGGEFRIPPRLHRIVNNTTWAKQSRTFKEQNLGSSTGAATQSFRLSQTPILPDPQLEVLEPQRLSAEELAALSGSGKNPDIKEVHVGAAEIQYWVPWQLVTDFYASGPKDRHYLVDFESGEVTFGDGTRGMIPLVGRDNIRTRLYQAGGGIHGNRPPLSITQLKTAIPYLDRATNFLASSGGSDLESLTRCKERSGHVIRHRGRAVTTEDFEDLAFDASPAVARAKAIPPYFDPVELNDRAVESAAHGVGTVLLVVLPNDDSPRPTPSLDLLNQVDAYLQRRTAPALRFQVSGPVWADVHIRARIAPQTIESGQAVLERARIELTRWLHPLTGGPEGLGWPFSRRPYDSDVYRLLANIPGIDFIESLKVDCPLIPEDETTLLQYARRALSWHIVCSGHHLLELAFSSREV